MPFTLAHSAAILPLRHVRFLRSAPLIIGSMAPDLPDYAPGWVSIGWGWGSHSFSSSYKLCLPLGMVLLAFCVLLRLPLTALLTARARALCLGALEPFRRHVLPWVLAPISILLGIWTHLIWDGVTHDNTFLFRRITVLSAPAQIGPYHGDVSHLLQYLSSVIGLSILAYWYLRLPTPPLDSTADTSRGRAHWLILALVLVAAVVIGGLKAIHGTTHSIYHLLYLLLTRIIAWFALLYFVAGVLVLLLNRRRSQPLMTEPGAAD